MSLKVVPYSTTIAKTILEGGVFNASVSTTVLDMSSFYVGPLRMTDVECNTFYDGHVTRIILKCVAFYIGHGKTGIEC